MAQKSLKAQATRNISTLNTLHLITLILNILFLLLHFLPFRLPLTSSNTTSLLAYFILSIPSFGAEFVLERSGRPVYVNGALKNPGQDLAAQGLTEYLFDIVWVTWGCLGVVLVVGNWGWLIWAAIPAYGAVKGYSLLGMARGMMGGGGMGGGAEGQEAPVPGNRKQRRMAA